MLRVLHLITELNTGGAEMMLFNLLSFLNADKIKSMVVSLSGDGPVGKRIRELGIEVRFLGFHTGRFSLSGFLELCGTIRQFKPDVIQTWLYHADFIGTLAALTTKKKSLFWNIRCSNMAFENYSLSSRMVFHACRYFSRIPDVTVYNSVNALTYHQNLGYPKRRAYVIPNGFDTQLFRPQAELRQKMRQRYHIPDHLAVLGMVGRFDPMKDHWTFLKSAAILKNRMSAFVIVFCGLGMTWKNPALVEMIKKCRMESHVILLGPRADMAAVMNMMDMLVSTSAYGEGFPNVVGEAMACGLPCVVTDVGDSAKIVGNAGRAVPPRAPDLVAGAILKILECPAAEWMNLKKTARQRIVQNYTIEKIARRYEQLYQHQNH